MSFLGADIVAATVIYINAKYSGWNYAGYVGLMLYLGIVLAGINRPLSFRASRPVAYSAAIAPGDGSLQDRLHLLD